MKRKKQIISLILACSMVLSVVATCGSATIDSLAASGSDLTGESLVSKYGLSSADILNYSDFVDSDIYDVDNYLPINGHYSTFDFSPYISSEYTSLENWGSVTYDTSCYALYKQGYIKYTVFPKDSFFVCNQSENALYVPQTSLTSSSDLMCITTYGNGTYNWFTTLTDFGVGTGTVDGSNYYIYYLNSSIEIIGSTNAAIYSASDPYNITTLNGLTQGNYSDSYNSLNGSSNNPTSANYLYLENADITYDIGDLNGGNVSCWGTPNQYQLEHPEQFTIKYRYNFSVDVAYNVIGGSHFKNSAVGSETYSISMEDYISNGYAVVKSLADIERACTFTDEGQTKSIRSVVETYYDRNVSNDWDPNKVRWYDFKLTTTFWVEDSENKSSWYQETYDFLTGDSTVNSNGLTTNSNPYSNSVSNNDLSADDVLNNGSGGTSNNNIPSSGSNNATGGSASATTGNITINNNPTFNNNSSPSASATGGSSSDSGFGSFLSTLILLLASGQESTSDSLSEITGAEGWLTVANTTLSTVPVSLWTILLATFSICITISIVAVVISILLKIFL